MENPGIGVNQEYKDILKFRDQVDKLAEEMLGALNQRSLKLFELSPHKRIFLFILTRAIKTCSAIEILCQSGYGQDVAALVRGLLENLVTVHYILRDPKTADEKTRRFVAYKWVIFRRHLPEEEKNITAASPALRQEFLKKKELISQQVEKFKKDFKITSDRALLTWSGKTVKDMARAVGQELLQEYESTFRLCSRFSHPTILGDKEYLIQNDNRLAFSPLPSMIGILPNLYKALKYYLDFLAITDELFELGCQERTSALKKQFEGLMNQIQAQEDLSPSSPDSEKPPNIRESIISFKLRPPEQ